MKAEADRLRDQIRDLAETHRRGDVPARKYPRLLADLSVDLCRAEARSRLAPSEPILEEHHVIRNHLKLNQSVLRDSDQEAVSLFLTERRLLSFRTVFRFEDQFTCDAADGTVVDEVPFGDIAGIERRSEFRIGEALTGALVALGAFLWRETLTVTGPLMITLGVLGVVHALLWPTRTVEIRRTDARKAPITIYSPRKKSAMKLTRRLDQAMAVSRPRYADGG